MRVKAPAVLQITTSTKSPAGCNQGSGKRGVGVGVFQSIPDLSSPWVCSLSFGSLNAPFEKSLTDREVVLRIQTQTCGQSDIKKILRVVNLKRGATQTDMCSTCNKKAEREERWDGGVLCNIQAQV